MHVDDDAFVRAPAPLVYRRLTDLGAWPNWWRDVQVLPMADAADRETWAVQLATSRWRALRVSVQPHAHRHDIGFKLTLTGDVAGEAEFWLEPSSGGTIVHHLMGGEAAGRPRSTLRTYRTALRRGLWGLKDALQTEVRTAVGMRP